MKGKWQASNFVFVLRVWRDAEAEYGRPAWRYVLEDPDSKARRGFASLPELAAYLERLQGPGDGERDKGEE